MKLPGMIITAACIFGAGCINAFEYRRELRFCEALLELIKYIRMQICTYGKPLDEIYGEFESPLLLRCGLLDVLRNEGFSAMLQSTAMCVSAEAEKILREFSSGLGKTLADDQIRLCDYTIANMEETIQRDRGSIRGRVKLSISVSGAAAAMLILLFI